MIATFRTDKKKDNKNDNKTDNNAKGKDASSHNAVEVGIYWKGELYDVIQLECTGDKHVDFRVGESFDCDFPMEPKVLNGAREFTLIRLTSETETTIRIPDGFTAALTITVGDPPQTKTSPIVASTRILEHHEKITLSVDDVKFKIRYVQKERCTNEIVLPGKTLPIIIGTSFIAHGVLLAILWSQPDVPKALSIEALENCRVFHFMFEQEFQKECDGLPSIPICATQGTSSTTLNKNSNRTLNSHTSQPKTVLPRPNETNWNPLLRGGI